VLLAPFFDGLSNELGDALVVAAARRFELPEARRVDVERFHRNVDLGLEAAGRVGVEAPSGLRERAARLEHAVASEGVAEHIRRNGHSKKG